jgi:ABC-type uncharacterized transport system substrate-binding protein
MRSKILLGLLILFLGAVSKVSASEQKIRIFVVSSYHRDYLWTKDTQRGLVAAMLDFGYLDSPEQGATFTREDMVESARAVVKKAWMDTKRKYSEAQIHETLAQLVQEIEAFRPDILLLGDDNAANYVGNHYLDSALPMIFWGVNSTPVKYGLLDSAEKPGHNITGVWQSGYHANGLEFLHALVPAVETFAIIAGNSPTTHAKLKDILALERDGILPLKLKGVVRSNALSEFKTQVLAMAETVDAFFVLNHDTLKDDNGRHIDMLQVGRWYLENVKKPEVSDERQFVEEGMFCAADDSGFNQAYAAFELAVKVLETGANPALLPARTPKRGPLLVNRMRAEQLGIDLEEHLGLVDEVVEGALAFPSEESPNVIE